MESSIALPPGFDWQHWITRWERMQERYVVGRDERFAVMMRMIRATQPAALRVLDLGCGPGSLTLRVLEAFPDAQVVGIDFDPTLLALARAQLARFGNRVKLVRADLRDSSWAESVAAPFDVVVSATALHWLAAEQLAGVYRRVGQVVRPGGIFLNADHVGSDSAPIQKAWEKHRDEMLAQGANTAADDWSGFWKAYGQVLSVDIEEIHQRMARDQEGVEQGMPLAWHFHELKASGFRHVDCFWRSDGDAIYGGIRADAKR